jgi:hypothetical protein
LKLSVSFTPDSRGFVRVRMADPRIVQKDEILIVPSACRPITHKRDE